MPSLYKEGNTLELSDLEFLLLVEMGFFNDLKKLKIRFNPKPSSTSLQLLNDKPVEKKEPFIDLHAEIVKKVDEIIEKHEREKQTIEPEIVTKVQQKLPLQEFVELRETSIKKPEIPQFQGELNAETVFTEISPEEDFFEIVPPNEVSQTPEIQQEDNDFQSVMIGEEESKSHKLFSGFANVKLKGKTTKAKKAQKKINGVTKTKIELERSKQEIEARKKALEEAKKAEKEKEEALKKAKEEKEKREKLKKIELKKKLKQKKIKEKEAKKAELLQQKLLKQQEKEKLRKQKLKEIELKRQQKEAEKERILKEKQKQKEKLKKQKEKEKVKPVEAKKKETTKPKKSEKPKKEKKGFFKKKKQVKKEAEEIPAPEFDNFIKEKATKDQKPSLDNDVEQLLPILDELLEKLPEDVIDDFAHSEKFSLYEKVMNKYKNK